MKVAEAGERRVLRAEALRVARERRIPGIVLDAPRQDLGSEAQTAIGPVRVLPLVQLLIARSAALRSSGKEWREQVDDLHALPGEALRELPDVRVRDLADPR